MNSILNIIKKEHGNKGKHPSDIARLRMSQAHKGKYTGEQCPSWRGGRTLRDTGYYWVKLQSEDFFYSMTNKQGYVLEHRLIMAKHLGRCLQSWEMVHHKNHKRNDNRISNLSLELVNSHNQITILEQRVKRLEIANLALSNRILLLEADKVLQNA